MHAANRGLIRERSWRNCLHVLMESGWRHRISGVKLALASDGVGRGGGSPLPRRWSMRLCVASDTMATYQLKREWSVCRCLRNRLRDLDMRIDDRAIAGLTDNEQAALNALLAAVYPPEFAATSPGRAIEWADRQWGVTVWDDFTG
jgi:hypothetical protein